MKISTVWSRGVRGLEQLQRRHQREQGGAAVEAGDRRVAEHDAGRDAGGDQAAHERGRQPPAAPLGDEPPGADARARMPTPRLAGAGGAGRARPTSPAIVQASRRKLSVPFRRHRGQALRSARSRRGSGGAARRRARAESPRPAGAARKSCRGACASTIQRASTESRASRSAPGASARSKTGIASASPLNSLTSSSSGARIRLPGDVPRRIAGVVVLESREIVLAAPRAAAAGQARRRRRRRRVRGRPRIDEAVHVRGAAPPRRGTGRREIASRSRCGRARRCRGAASARGARQSLRRRPRLDSGACAAPVATASRSQRGSAPGIGEGDAEHGVAARERRLGARRRARPAPRGCGGRRASRRRRARASRNVSARPRLFP